VASHKVYGSICIEKRSQSYDRMFILIPCCRIELEMGWGEFIVIKVVWHFSPVECENRYLDLEVVSQSHLARQTNFDKLIEKQGENNELLPDEKKNSKSHEFIAPSMCSLHYN